MAVRVFLVAIIVGLVVVGCAGPQPKVMRYTYQNFSPTEHVEILRTTIPDRQYIEIAEISIKVKKGNRESAVTLLSEKAAKLGADALLLMGERSVGAVAIPVGEMVFAKPIREVYGIAIKYK